LSAAPGAEAKFRSGGSSSGGAAPPTPTPPAPVFGTAASSLFAKLGGVNFFVFLILYEYSFILIKY
jgi:hypothetical protein